MNAPNAPLACPLCEQSAAFFFADSKNFQQSYHRCLRCDLVFVAPDCRLDSEAERARYDMHINDYSEPYVQFLSRLAKPMLEQLTEPAEGLDFGSGKSQAMAELFRQQGHNCTCYDVFYYPDKAALSKTYDFIVASEVIEHLYTPKAVVEQWLQLLKPKGLLGVMTGLCPDDKEFPNWWYKNDPTHVSLFSRQTFDYLAEQYRLQCVYEHKNVLVFNTLD